MILCGAEGRQGIGTNEDPYRSWGPGCALDKALSLEGEDHLMNGGRRYAEVTLEVGFGGRAAQHDRIGMDEGEVLPLLV